MLSLGDSSQEVDCIFVVFACDDQLYFHTEHGLGEVIVWHSPILIVKYVSYIKGGFRNTLITRTEIIRITPVSKKTAVHHRLCLLGDKLAGFDFLAS